MSSSEYSNNSSASMSHTLLAGTGLGGVPGLPGLSSIGNTGVGGVAAIEQYNRGAGGGQAVG